MLQTIPNHLPLLTDTWEEEKPSKNVRYVPIQIETGHPSTSTPNESTTKVGSRVRHVPIKFVDISSNGPSSTQRKPRMHTPVKPVIRAIIDDDEDDQEVNKLVFLKTILYRFIYFTLSVPRGIIHVISDSVGISE